MKHKLYCVESQSWDVQRRWKARKFHRPVMILAKHYVDRVQVKPQGVIIYIGIRGQHHVRKANVWRRLAGKQWKCLRMDYPETKLARQHRVGCCADRMH